MWNWALKWGLCVSARPVTSIGMPAGYHSVDLSRYVLRPGEGRRLDLDADPGPLDLGGQQYVVRGGTVSARLDLSRTAAGYAIRMRFIAHVDGPCMRCLQDADVAVEIDAREVDLPRTDDEELVSPYISDDELDLARWAHDALALALPIQLLCRPECRGLCPVCGESLNDADPAEHQHESAPDPRWDKLRELKLDR
jgi:uncharacterized protein